VFDNPQHFLLPQTGCTSRADERLLRLGGVTPRQQAQKHFSVKNEDGYIIEGESGEQ
jgi:hypothetical protein